MTAAVYRSTPSLLLPQTQNTAPVLEFNCLYTHDIRRKQKRWQDGFLRYHTFNKRVMVYDVPRNYIGDAHWTADEALQDGDELTLEKGGVLVQVAEATGKTETDLTELRKSARKGSSERGSSPPARAPQTPSVRAVHGTASRPQTQLKHRSLNALLGTPKGPVGKAALPAKSPFELRRDNVENEQREDGRPPKRQRMENPRACDVTRTTTAAKSAGRKETPLWARTADASKEKKKLPLQPGQPSLEMHAVVDLRDDEPEPERFLPGFSSDALIPPSSPPREQTAAKKQQAPMRSSSPAFQTQKAQAKRTMAPEQVDNATASIRPPSAPSVTARAAALNSTESRYAHQPNHDTRTDGHDRRKDQSVDIRHRPNTAVERPQSSAKGSTLRITAGAPKKKKMLLCQDQLKSKPKRISSTNTDTAADRLLGAASDDDDDDDQQQAKTQRQLLEERLARIRKKEARTHPERARAGKACARVHEHVDNVSNTEQVVDRTVIQPAEEQPQSGEEVARVHERVGTVPDTEKIVDDTVMQIADEQPQTSHEASALQLAKLDRMIMPDKSKEIEKLEHHDIVSACTEAPQKAAPSSAQQTGSRPPPRKRLGVGRREIRSSAQSCFQKPVEEELMPQPAESMFECGPESEPRPGVPPLPQRKERQFRRVVSDSSNAASAKPRRIPGAPMRFTPSPSKQMAAAPRSNSDSNTTATNPPAAPLQKFQRPVKKPFQRAVSLNTAASGTATVMLGRPFQPPKPPSADKDAGDVEVAPVADPWSREAFDLFDWRPPGWDEERWCFKEMEKAIDGVAASEEQ